MSLRQNLPLALACLLPGAAAAQTSFVAPDGKNRYPGVTIFCPSGTGVAPCSFGSGGGGGGGGPITVNGQAVSASNRLPTADGVLDGLLTGGALPVTGSVGLAGSPTVSLGAGTLTVGSVAQAGAWTVALAGGSQVGLAQGSNAIGSVSVSNLPAVQPVSGAVSQAGTWSVGLAQGTNAIGSVNVSNLPAIQPVSGAVSQAGSWTVGLASGTSVGLAQGSNAIGSVSVSNLPAVQPISGAVSQTGSWTVGLSAGSNDIGLIDVNSLPALPAGSNAIGSVAVSNFPATQPISGGVSQSGSWTVNLGAGASVGLSAGSNAIGSVSISNLPATQAISASSLPLPGGAATSAAQTAPLAPVAPGTGAATSSMLIGCLSNTTLPGFTAGQEGAVPCDSSGRPYVVTVPSANNVPAYLQAVTTGGATVYRAINAASSAMAAGVKSSTGMVFGYEACNSGTSTAFLRLFALGTAPTVGTSTPAISKLIPAGSCQNFSTPLGLVFSTGIGVDATSGSMADSDTTTIATASTVTVEIYYK